MTETKICSKCKVEKSLDEFNMNLRAKDGKNCHCKACRKHDRSIHKEERKLYDKQYCKDNKEIIAIKSKKYRHEHRDELKAAKHKYYIKNRESILDKTGKYKSENPQIVRKCTYNQRSKRNGWGKVISINKPFLGSHLHHLHVFNEETGEIDHCTAINIPGKLHKSIWHAYNRPETMIAINLKVMQWYYGLTIDW